MAFKIVHFENRQRILRFRIFPVVPSAAILSQNQIPPFSPVEVAFASKIRPPGSLCGYESGLDGVGGTTAAFKYQRATRRNREYANSISDNQFVGAVEASAARGGREQRVSLKPFSQLSNSFFIFASFVQIGRAHV